MHEIVFDDRFDTIDFGFAGIRFVLEALAKASVRADEVFEIGEETDKFAVKGSLANTRSELVADAFFEIGIGAKNSSR